MAASNDDPRSTASWRSPGATSRCSDTSRRRIETIASRSCAPFGVPVVTSTARSHSLSKPIDRLLRFDEPTRSSRSSSTSTLACT